MRDKEREADASELAGLLQFLQYTPDKVAKLLDGLADEELRWRNSDLEFSALENVCHLRDIEAEGYAPRIDRILNQTNPFLADIDGGRLAVERSYNDQDVEPALKDFVAARTRNLEKLGSASAEQLEREGTLEGVGKLTLKRLTELIREHDEGHIEDLRVLRRQLKANQPI